MERTNGLEKGKGSMKAFLILALVFSAALTATGCGYGMQMGTPEYWREYNESIRGGAKRGQQVASLERLTESDRGELNGIVRRVGQ